VIPTDADPEGHIYSFDTASGDLLWKVPFPHGVATTPLLIDERVVAISVAGEVVSIDAKSGKVLWLKAPAGTLKPFPRVRSPAHAAGRVFVADNTNRILALAAATGETAWNKTLPARVNTALLVVGNSLVSGTEDGYMNWLAIDSGELTKRIRLGEGYPLGTPILASPLLYVLTGGEKGTLIALDAESGAIQWKQETPKEWTTYRPLLAGSSIIVGNAEKNLCAFDRLSGESQWCRSTGQTPRGLGISNDGILYVGSLSGVVQAFRVAPERRDATRERIKE